MECTDLLKPNFLITFCESGLEIYKYPLWNPSNFVESALSVRKAALQEFLN